MRDYFLQRGLYQSNLCKLDSYLPLWILTTDVKTNNRTAAIRRVQTFFPTVPTFAVRKTASLGIMGAPRVPQLCRETQSLGQQMLNAPVGINGLMQKCFICFIYSVSKYSVCGSIFVGEGEFSSAYNINLYELILFVESVTYKCKCLCRGTDK